MEPFPLQKKNLSANPGQKLQGDKTGIRCGQSLASGATSIIADQSKDGQNNCKLSFELQWRVKKSYDFIRSLSTWKLFNLSILKITEKN